MPVHNRLVTALQRRIDAHVSAKGCESDASGATLANGRSPDIVVTCDERDLTETDDFINERIVRYPTLVVEVLSPSTRDADLGRKVDLYRALESVREYLILDSQTRFARLYRRDETHPDQLSMLPDRIGGVIDLQSIDLTVSLDELYADARIPVPSRTSREVDPVLAVAGLPCDRTRSLIDVEIRNGAIRSPADDAYLAVRTDEGLTPLRERPASVAT